MAPANMATLAHGTSAMPRPPSSPSAERESLAVRPDRQWKDHGKRMSMRADEYEMIRSRLTAPGSVFEVVPAEIGGRTYKSWAQAPTTLRAILERSRSFGDQTFIVFEDERLSHAAHVERVARCASALRARYGIGKGDRVAIAMRNLPEWSIAFWAVVSLGAVAVSINAWMTGPEMQFCIGDSGSRLLIADDDRIERLGDRLSDLALEAVIAVRSQNGSDPRITPWQTLETGDGPAILPPVTILPDDDATILYTSGTTGNPKGALGTHRGSCNNVITTRYFNAVDAVSRGTAVETLSLDGRNNAFLLTIPLFHGAGCQNGLIFSVFGGGKMVMMPRWDAQRALDTIAAEQITDMVATPAHFVQLLDLVDATPGRHAIGSVETVLVGGASPPADLPARIHAAMPKAAVGTGYGQTECTQIATLSCGSDYIEHPKSCGRPVPICDIRIVDDAGAEVAAGQTGELLLSTSTLVKAYVNRPAETAETFVDGWLKTGDLVHLDADGRMHIDDRKKDMVIRGGENIYCIEVEQALYSHPDVEEAAVFGLPHPVLGEEPYAMVFLRANSDASDPALRAHAGERLAKFKIPVEIRPSAAPLPRNANGKILKRELRAAWIAERMANPN
ncbi:hypothetical protein HY78_07315 [Rhizorhabdus wittichii DC-6]|nr:hypothetical protein HY78_07315 [Rhizorhabdus wittichii DC-6]